MAWYKRSKNREVIAEKPLSLNWLQKFSWPKIVIFLTILIVLSLISLINFIPGKTILKEGEIASQDILSPRTMEFVDIEATINLKEKAAKSIKEVYELNLANIENAELQTDNLFLKIKKYKEGIKELIENSPEPLSEKVQRQLIEEESKKMAEEIDKNLRLYISRPILTSCLQLDDLTLEKIRVDVKNAVRKIMEQGIREEDLDTAKKQLIREISEISIDHNDALIASEIASSAMLPSLFLNKEETEKRRQAAISSIEEIKKMIQKGQIIIRKGEVATAEQIAILNALGLQNIQINYLNFLGIILVITILLVLVSFYLHSFHLEIYNNISKLILISIISTFLFLLAKITYQVSPYIIPVASGAMLLAITIKHEISLLITTLLSLLITLIIVGEINFFLVAIVSGVIAIFSIRKTTQRSGLTRAGLGVALVNVITISALGLIQNKDSYFILKESLYGLLNGFLAVVLTIGILPFLENVFDITTPFKLMELSNPNQPLLKRLIVEAPGTYHHSIVVGNLSEAATEEMGGDGLLARVGSLYHDIGKIKRPYFFAENQEAYKNIHDDLEPSLSALVIASHVKEGVEMAKKNKLPKDIIDIINQHHGTGLITYFFHRALKEEELNTEEVAEENYRYSGPKPQTKEAGIILLADSVEAATRSLTNPTATRIKTLVKEIIKKNLDNGQLDESALTLKDLDKVEESFTRILTGMFHSRVEYPDEKIIMKLKEEKKKNGSINKKSTENSKDKPKSNESKDQKDPPISES